MRRYLFLAAAAGLAAALAMTQVPAELFVTEQTGILTTRVCYYTAKTITSHALNAGARISFTKEKLAPIRTEATGCPKATLTFSATIGPLRDASIAVDPRVYVN